MRALEDLVNDCEIYGTGPVQQARHLERHPVRHFERLRADLRNKRPRSRSYQVSLNTLIASTRLVASDFRLSDAAVDCSTSAALR